jgi:D-alanyl-D-alanine carboxypeptidase/D-alanyl-D-alanine-endopeptidase (penicillin-binding protein 4)
LAVLTLAGCGASGAPSAAAGPGSGAAVRPAPTVATPGSAGSPAATGTQATATSTVDHERRSPALVHLQAVLERSARSLSAYPGAGVGIAVEDLRTGQMLFGQGVNVARAPASLEKLYTSSALLWLLGPNARLHTQLLGSGYLFAGVWHGNLYLRGDGDPTFGDGGWNKLYEDGYGPTGAQLVADLRARGIRRVTGHLYADPFRFDSAEGGPATHDAPDPGDYGGRMSALVYDHGYIMDGLGPAATTVHLVAVTARLSDLGLYASRRLARTPPGASVLATLSSPKLSTLLSLMDIPSDDLFADLLAKQLGYHFDGRGTLSLGAQVIRRAIAAHYGLAPTIFDGSGLDKADRSTPAQFLALLRRMSGTPVGTVLRGALPVVGRSGTVAGIGLKTPAAGRCEAKTGTLNDVTNLAGYCRARGGDTLAFVFMVDGPSNDDSVYAFTPMIGAVAGY